MTRITLTLPGPLAAALRAESFRDDRPMSSIARKAFALYFTRRLAAEKAAAETAKAAKAGAAAAPAATTRTAPATGASARARANSASNNSAARSPGRQHPGKSDQIQPSPTSKKTKTEAKNRLTSTHPTPQPELLL